MTCCESEARDRTVLFVATPALWPAWPFLAMVRRAPAGTELGVVFDARRSCARTGYSATVFRCNLFELPPTLAEFLAQPSEVFDTAEELAEAGWRVD